MADFDDFLQEVGDGLRFELGQDPSGGPAGVSLEHVAKGRGAQANSVTLRNSGSFSIVDDNGDTVGTLTSGRGGAVLSLGGGRGRQPLVLLDGGTADATIGGGDNAPGDLMVRDGRNAEVFRVNGGEGSVTIGATRNGMTLDGLASTGEAAFHVDTDADSDGDADADSVFVKVGTADRSAQISVRDSNDNETIRIDGESGDIQFFNADFAEQFPFPAELGQIAPGTVLEVADTGEVLPCRSAVSTRVVGVAAGAGEHKPALVLDSRDDENRVAVAVVGKVRCFADATTRPIEVGDLLVSSPIDGHACAAVEAGDAVGAILGKALTPLAAGTGTVRMLVSLQ